MTFFDRKLVLILLEMIVCNKEEEGSVKADFTIVRTLREDQALRLLLNLLFYHFNHSEPIYKSQLIKHLNVVAACNQLNVNALN